MRVVVLMTTPFQSDPTPPASPRDQEHPSATRDSSIAVTRRALLPTSAALLVETTIVADGHGALLAPSGSSAGPLTVSLSCTTFIDGQPGGGSIAFSLPGATGLGSPPIDPEGNQEGATFPDVVGSRSHRFRRYAAGDHEFSVVCSTNALVPVRGLATLAVLQSEW